MSLPVGIHEGVAFDFKVNDVNGKSVFNVVLTQPGDAEAAFDFDNTGAEGNQSDNTQITAWPITIKGLEDGKVADNRRPVSIAGDIKDAIAYRTALLTLFMPADQIQWETFRGLDINTDSIKANPSLLLNDELLGVITKNLNTQTLEQFKAFGSTTDLFRVALIRQSKKSHLPKLRDRYLDKNVIAESMDVPVEDSKVGFTASEIKAKLNDPTPIAPDADSAKGAEEVLGGQVADPKGVPEGL